MLDCVIGGIRLLSDNKPQSATLPRAALRLWRLQEKTAVRWSAEIRAESGALMRDSRKESVLLISAADMMGLSHTMCGRLRADGRTTLRRHTGLSTCSCCCPQINHKILFSNKLHTMTHRLAVNHHWGTKQICLGFLLPLVNSSDQRLQLVLQRVSMLHKEKRSGNFCIH